MKQIDHYASATDESLDKSLRAVIREVPGVPTRAVINRRRWTGLCALVGSLHCVFLAGPLWPEEPHALKASLLFLAFLALVAGIALIAMAARQEERAARLVGDNLDS